MIVLVSKDKSFKQAVERVADITYFDGAMSCLKNIRSITKAEAVVYVLSENFHTDAYALLASSNFFSIPLYVLSAFPLKHPFEDFFKIKSRPCGNMLLLCSDNIVPRNDIVDALHDAAASVSDLSPNGFREEINENTYNDSDISAILQTNSSDAPVYRGSLDKFELPQILTKLHLARKSGTVHLDGGNAKYRIELRSGNFTANNNVNVLLSTFAMKDGFFRFEENFSATVDEKASSGDKAFYLIIVKGIENYMPTNHISKIISPFFNQYPTTVHDNVSAFTPTRALKFCNGQNTLADILKITGYDIASFVSDIYLLYVTEQITFLKTLDLTFNLGESERLQKIKDDIRQMSEAHLYKIFGLESGCGTDALRQAFSAWLKFNHPDSIAKYNNEELNKCSNELLMLINIHLKTALKKERLLQGANISPAHSPLASDDNSKADESAGATAVNAYEASKVTRSLPVRPVPSASRDLSGTSQNLASPLPQTAQTLRPPSPPVMPQPPKSSVRASQAGQIPTLNAPKRPSQPLPPAARRITLQNPGAPQAPKVPTQNLNSLQSSPVSFVAPGIFKSETTGTQTLQKPTSDYLSKYKRPSSAPILDENTTLENAFGQGKRYLLANRYEEAEKFFKFCQSKSDHPIYVAYAYWSEYLRYPGTRNNLITRFNEIPDGKNDADTCYFLGRLYMDDAKFDAAVAQFKKALRLSPDFHDARRDLGLAEQRLREQQQSAGNLFDKLKNALKR